MTGLSSLLGALGLVAIVFALLSFVVAIFSAATGSTSDMNWVGGNLLIGILLLIAAAVMNFDGLRERMSSGEARRAGKYGSSAIVSTLLAIVILGLLGFMATRYPVRFDWSEQKVHTLSDQSKKVLAGLEEDVNVLALYQPIDADPVRDLLGRYTYESDRFALEFADPNARPGLLEEYGVDPNDLSPGLVRVAFGDDSVQVTEVTEENITNALVKLTRTGEKRVYFLEGHGEHAIEGEGGDLASGYARAAEALRNENYRVDKLLLAAVGSVPADADVVIAAGASRPFLDVERRELERYVNGGGALLALIDPRAKTDLVELVDGWGVSLVDDIVVDRTLAVFGRAMTPFAASYDPTHEITQGLREPTVFHETRSVSARAGEFTEIVFTGDASWAERSVDELFATGKATPGGDDRIGPVPVAVAGRPDLSGAASDNGDNAEDTADESEAAEPRLAVYGDADFASNELIEAYRNRDLFINTVNWLIGDVEAISVRPNRSRASRFTLSNDQFRTIRSLSLFVLPEAIAVLGVFTWWTRREPAR